jgi:tetratricopeptide (TPR) repeat protein
MIVLVVLAGIIVAGLIFTTWKKTPRLGISPTASQFTLESEKQTYATYGGSVSCRECHTEAYEAWRKSNHGLAERLPEAKMDGPAFALTPRFQHGSQQTSAQKLGEQFQLRTTGPHGTQEVFQIDRIIGQSPLRQALVAFPGGRWQATEVAYDPRTNDWFNVYGAEDRRAGEWGHWTGRGMNWNSMCATCHNTRLRKNYDVTNDVYHTAMVERSVGCESCHGPMKAHHDWQYANKGKGLTDPTIKKFSRDQMFDTCAACHSRRGEITGDPKPGDSFFDHHLLSIVDESDLFYADGQVRDEDYEVSAFLGSKMFHKGVRCADCHDFHTAKVRLPGNMMCLSCHGLGQTNAPVINPVTHSRHKVFGFDPNGVMLDFDLSTYQLSKLKETGGECVNCHMPQTVYMQRHSRHDHGFTIPDPLLTKQFGIPNACNRCHQDKNADWALKFVEQWYGDKMNRPSRQRAQTIARARIGDDAARGELLKMLQTDEQDYWRAVAANLLERWVGEAPVATALVTGLSNTNALVRQNIVQTLAALGESASPEIRAALNNRLTDPSRNVRVAAAQALLPTLNLESLAGSEYLHMLQHNADQPAGQMQLGGLALARGDATNALRHFQTAARWDSYSPGIRHELAIVLSQLNRPNEALQQLQEAVRLAPRDAEFRFKLALAWNELGETAKTLAELEVAVKLDPRHARAGYNLGLARNAAGNPTGAINALLAAETADPHDPRIPYARATIHARLGQLPAARQAAQRALELNPQSAEAAALLQQLQPK